MKKINFFLSLLLIPAFATSASAKQPNESVLIRCDGSCSKAVRAVKKAGGDVKHRYQYANAIAASIPSESHGTISRSAGVGEITKDFLVDAPKAVEEFKLEGADAATPSGSGLAALAGRGEDLPKDYLFNVPMMGAEFMFGMDYLGDGAITAVIDSGTSQHPAFSRDGCAFENPTVMGGETYIGGADPAEPSATSYFNGDHGTWVGTTIAANIAYYFSNDGSLAPAMHRYAPESIFLINEDVSLVPMLGVAPCSHIYALKTFSAAGGGAPSSDIIAAMERAITLKMNFDAGKPSVPVSGTGAPEDPFVYDSLNIEVVNMSLGGTTMFAAYDIDDLLTEVMNSVGITLTNSAGNEGHAAMTGGSAGTGRGSLTAAAASSAAHERILRDLQYGTGVGGLYRPSDHTQTASFSSRGPSADGRISTDATANGHAVLAGYADGSCCGLVSGTSFSAPQIAGAAALLHQAFPDASGEQVRNALVYGADPDLLGDNSGSIDQGHGFIDIPAAYAMLDAGKVPSGLPAGAESATVKGNIASLGFKAVSVGARGYSTSFNNLMPGQVGHLFLDSKKNTDAFEVCFNATPELDPADQNAFFGDDLFVLVQDALTSDEDVLGTYFMTQGCVSIPNPQTGIVRVGIMGDWTNAGRISTDVFVTEVRSSRMPKLFGGKVAQGGSEFFEVSIPEETSEVTFELSWNNNWGAYPTDDLDLILFHPLVGPVFDAATLASPERAVLTDPIAGPWEVYVDGFTVWGVHGGGGSKYQLHAWDQDGNSL